MKKASSFENEIAIIEFNNQITLHFNAIKELGDIQAKTSLNLIPTYLLKGLDLSKVVQNEESELQLNPINNKHFQLENFIEHLNPQEIAYCFFEGEALKGNKNEFTLTHNFEEHETINNYLALNILKSKTLVEKKDLTKLIAKEYSIGQEIFYLSEYTKKDFSRILNDPNIPKEIKEEFYNVEFDDQEKYTEPQRS